jgi:Winged helix DNA-binding domain
VLIRWDGARQPEVWTAPAPAIDHATARTELLRRHLHVFGPSTPEAFAHWAGIPDRAGAAAFASLRRSLTSVRTPIGDAWILARDEPELRADPPGAAPVRLLPSGDAYFLLWGAERALLVPDANRRGELWTPRVWPGAVLLEGELRGIWRRADEIVTVRLWGRPSRASRAAVEAEAAELPLPGCKGPIGVRFE